MSFKKNISFVLIEPKKGGNVGASARALHNMGFKNLVLVNSNLHLDEEAKTFAMKGAYILQNAKSFDTLEEAIAESSLVVGLTRRRGKKRGLFYEFEEGIQKIRERASKNKVSVIFGRENSGLSNKETERCHFLITIPTGNTSSSINLSQSVLIMAYELSRYEMIKTRGEKIKSVTVKELDYLLNEVKNTLIYLNYGKRGDRDLLHSILRTMKGFFTRKGLTKAEMNMFLGIFKELRKKGGDS
ncbi:MAG: TrmJ/YjtD family RNA methyltransferase [Candidatus Schekmanbacteria bacterium]|nr:MAG: TrmJ/YjtD family RNA methyltransferase [Candidatus Schekmanbacteria bacterium]